MGSLITLLAVRNRGPVYGRPCFGPSLGVGAFGIRLGRVGSRSSCSGLDGAHFRFHLALGRFYSLSHHYFPALHTYTPLISARLALYWMNQWSVGVVRYITIFDSRPSFLVLVYPVL